MQLIKILQVAKAFGIKGALKVNLFSNHISDYSFIYDESGNRYFFSFLKAPNKNDALIFIEGIQDRTVAEKLKGKFFYIKESDLQDLSINEYYIEDLIGKKVEVIGSQKNYEVIGVHNFGAGDLLEIKTEEKSFLIPFTKEIFPDNAQNILNAKKEIIDLYDV